MRATSVIFLIVAVVLVLVGIVTCTVGATLAEEQGIELFDTVADADNNLVYTYNYAGEGIKKIAVNIGDADVNVYGGSDADYIELINFPQGVYDLSATNLTLSLVDNSSLLKIFSLGQNGFNFHGFRHFFHSLDISDKTRTVNIYLTENSAVTLLDIALKTGNLTVQNIDRPFDLYGKLEAGDVVLENISTTSDVKLTLGTGSVKTEDVLCRALKLEAASAEVDLDTFCAEQSMEVKLTEGSVTFFPSRRELNGYRVKLSAPAGRVSYFGESVGSSYAVDSTEDETRTFLFETEKGNITVE